MTDAAGARPVVIGLAGGVGAGKSVVAAAFAELGLLVADSDRASREALDREDVKATLVGWWGEDVLDEDGAVDRARVASIVFEDETERERLEDLVHPLVRETRDGLVARAVAEGAPGVIIDAPLLFEAGLDAECDAVVFVEAPHPVRLDRVRRGRGWDERELDRREAAQWGIDRKRAACGHVIDNGGAGVEPDCARLREAAAEVLARVIASV